MRFGWATAIGSGRGDGLDAGKAPLVCFRLAAKIMSKPVGRPLQTHIEWQNTSGSRGPDGCVSELEMPLLQTNQKHKKEKQQGWSFCLKSRIGFPKA